MSLILGTDNASYHANTTHLSSSAIKVLLKDPAQFHREYVLGQRVQITSDAFTEGSLVHTLILEPDQIGQYAIFSGLKKAGTAWEIYKKLHTDKTIVRVTQMLRCQELYKSYAALPVAVNLLKDTLSEHNMIGNILKVPVKARADAIKPGHYIVDVKTTSMPSDPDIFKQTIQDYSYQLSAALYCQIALETYGVPHDFYWLVLSKDDKQCHVYKASTETLAEGTAMYTKALVTYKKCKESNIWLAEQSKIDYSDKEYEIQEL